MYEDARMIMPMKIWHLPEDKEQDFKTYADSGDYFAELKVDGALYIYEKTKDNAFEINYRLDVPVRDDIYDYIVSGA